MKPKPRPEKAEQAAIVQLLRSIGATVYILGHPSPADGRTFRGTGQTPGIPDLYAFLPPKQHHPDWPIAYRAGGLWVEVKRVGGKLRPEQADFRDRCVRAGLPHVVGTCDAVIAWLVEAGYLVARDGPRRQDTLDLHGTPAGER